MTYEEWLRLQHYTDRTIHNHTRQLHRFNQWCIENKIANAVYIGHNRVVRYVGDCISGRVTRKTVAHYMYIIKKYYSWLINCGLITDNPCDEIIVKGVVKRTLHQVLSKEELERLFNEYPLKTKSTDLSTYTRGNQQRYLSRFRNKLIIGFVVYQGLSIDEIMQVTTDDISIRERTVRLKGVGSFVARTLALHEDQAAYLQDYLQTVRPAMLSIIRGSGITNQLIFCAYGGTTYKHLFESLLRQVKWIDQRVKCIEQLRASVLVQMLDIYYISKGRDLAGENKQFKTQYKNVYPLPDLEENIRNYHPF
jgi:integrase/recombinase XerD